NFTDLIASSHGVAGLSWKEVQFRACCNYKVIRIIEAGDTRLIGLGHTRDGLDSSGLGWRVNQLKHNEFNDVFQNPTYIVVRFESNGKYIWPTSSTSHHANGFLTF